MRPISMPGRWPPCVRVPGLQSVRCVNSMPFGSRRGTAGITTDAEGKHFGGVIEFYVGGPGSLKALGAKVVAGRGASAGGLPALHRFHARRRQPCQMTQALAEHLWPGRRSAWQGILGRAFHYRVGGRARSLVRPDADRVDAGTANGRCSCRRSRDRISRAATCCGEASPICRGCCVTPCAAVRQGGSGRGDRSEASQTLDRAAPAVFRNDRAMAGMLVGVIAALLLVTALGIVGLASFWVAQRRRQIGVRRALGATRARHPALLPDRELPASSRSASCWAWSLAYGLNLLLMQHYELPRLPRSISAGRRAGAVGAWASWRCSARPCAPPPCRPWWQRGRYDRSRAH